MSMPHVDKFAFDRTRRVKYNVKAYRKLSNREILLMIRMYLARERRRPKRNSTVMLVTVIS